jgi:3-hydroxyisobutyrate dehydrogenase-like beta-hydroxyacid dehydrogenase
MAVAAISAVYFEVFVWAAKNGVPPDVLLDAFKNGASNSNVLRGDVGKFCENKISCWNYLYRRSRQNI